MSDHFAKMLLQITSSTIKQFTELQQERGDDFNVFKILGTERSEVGTHSKFLFEVLNPVGCHSQGSIFVDLFLTKVLGLKQAGKVLEVNREDLTQENRRIDFTIKTDKYLIGLEMKIDAGDQPAQLSDYYRELQFRNRNDDREMLLFYLTLDGKEPNKESMQGLKKEDVNCVSFENEIVDWLNACIEVVALKPVIRELINQYRLLITEITHQNEVLDLKIAQEIEKNEENLIAAEEIMKAYALASARIEANVWSSLITSLTQKPDIFEDDVVKSLKACRSKTGEKGWFEVRFKIGEMTTENNVYVWASFSNHNDYNYLVLDIYPGDEKGQKQKYDFTKNEIITNSLIIKLNDIKDLKKKYAAASFVHGNIDDTFKLRGCATNLSEWIGVTDKTDKIKRISEKVDKTLIDIKDAVDDWIIDN